MKLSIIMPVFNERNTIKEIIERVKCVDIDKEIIIVDDYSMDGTRDILKTFIDDNIKVIYHNKNRGKGAAVRTGLSHVSGEIVIIQDADLEYDPRDYKALIRPIIEGRGDAVYGSRFLGEHRVFLFWHYLGNKFLTFITNVLYNAMLSDMETCYKAFRTDIIISIKIRSNSFNIEPEITAKLFKKKYRVYEVPITYSGRSYEEGKKITWKDGFKALYTLIKFRFMD
ncbi:MAG: glycosyltransferase family 2 protein [candidate division Zixibacteria bacterium]|nr:glycosyltransferase family 2 protein [candidate division Zixibacteria bacterium]